LRPRLLLRRWRTPDRCARSVDWCDRRGRRQYGRDVRLHGPHQGSWTTASTYAGVAARRRRAGRWWPTRRSWRSTSIGTRVEDTSGQVCSRAALARVRASSTVLFAKAERGLARDYILDPKGCPRGG